jgi:hypothetical protein
MPLSCVRLIAWKNSLLRKCLSARRISNTMILFLKLCLCGCRHKALGVPYYNIQKRVLYYTTCSEGLNCHTAVFSDITVTYYSVQCRHVYCTIGSATLRLAQYRIQWRYCTILQCSVSLWEPHHIIQWRYNFCSSHYRYQTLELGLLVGEWGQSGDTNTHTHTHTHTHQL